MKELHEVLIEWEDGPISDADLFEVEALTKGAAAIMAIQRFIQQNEHYPTCDIVGVSFVEAERVDVPPEEVPNLKVMHHDEHHDLNAHKTDDSRGVSERNLLTTQRSERPNPPAVRLHANGLGETPGATPCP